MRIVQQIATGFINDILKREEELHQSRIAICEKCPIYDTSMAGPVCSAKKYYNTKTKVLTQYPSVGATNGCGCLLNKKTRVKDAKCPLDKWPKD